MAQFPQTFWGLDLTIAPLWKVPAYQSAAFNADHITMQGHEYAFGFVRADPKEGDWGLSFVLRTVRSGSSVVKATTTTTATSGVKFVGFDAHKFIAFTTIKDRVQIGMNLGIGVTAIEGNATQTVGTQPAKTVKADQLFKLRNTAIPVMPILRLEAAGAYIVSPAIKIKVSGGFDFPGQEAVRLSLVYLFGAF